MTALFELKAVSLVIEGRGIVHDVSLDVAPGRVIGLIGHNGSGKSTLLRMMSGQQPPSSGDVRFKDRPIGQWRSRELARVLAYLPQMPPPTFVMTVRELVEFGRYPWHGALGRFGRNDRRKVAEAIAATGLEPFVDRFVETLSGGERQRVWLAMLLAQDAECLLLDEPTSALDIAHQMDVLSLIHRLGRERSIVVVLHDVNMAARFCDEIVAMHSGRIISRGTPDELMRADALERIYGLPMDVMQHEATGRFTSYVV